MIEKTGFNLTTVSRSPYHRGFQMTMTNGYTVSVQFGPGSISSVKNFSLDEPISLDTIDEKVENAEIMVFASDGTPVPFKTNGEVSKGHVSPLTRRDAVASLSTHLCKVIFKKKTTGEIREMNCTLDPTHMPSGVYESLGNYDRYRPYTSKGTQSSVVQAWDTDKGAWRSFDINFVQSFEQIED